LDIKKNVAPVDEMESADTDLIVHVPQKKLLKKFSNKLKNRLLPKSYCENDRDDE
jgi:hypothetical protein